MISEFRGHVPSLHKHTYVADGAKVIGKVEMAEYSSLWYNVVARGDVNKIVVGKYTNVQDGSILHVADDCPTIIGDYVTIGHNCIIHGCEIEDHCLIGMGAIVLNNAKIGRGSTIAAGAVVKENAVIPPFSLVVGIPGKVVRTSDESAIEDIHKQSLKYKTLWSEWYGIIPDCGGERYEGKEAE